MKRWQALIVYAFFTGVTIWGCKVLTTIYTVAVFKEGVSAGIDACHKKQNYETGVSLSSDVTKVIDLEYGIAQTLRE